jgi:hypothetical protein
MTFSVMVWFWKDGEPQLVVSCDQCRMNCAMGAHSSFLHVLQWGEKHVCPLRVQIFTKFIPEGKDK